MSKIQAELMAATGLKPVRNETKPALLERLVLAVAKVSDAAWEKLSEAAQDWANAGADAYKAKKAIEGFPDEAKEEAPASSRRRGTPAAEAEQERLTQVGDTVTVTTNRDKVYTGEVIEIDKEVIVLDVDGKEKEFEHDSLKSIEIEGADGGDAGEDGAGDAGPDDGIDVGAQVTVVTKRGKTVVGEIVELTDEFVAVKDADGKEHEFDHDRVESMTPVAAKEEPPATSRRGGRTAAAKEEPKDDGKHTRATNQGVSVGARVRELMCADLALTEEAVGKALKKEGLEFRDATLKMLFKDTSNVFDLLKKNKKLK